MLLMRSLQGKGRLRRGMGTDAISRSEDEGKRSTEHSMGSTY